jgi:hypothetical protein
MWDFFIESGRSLAEEVLPAEQKRRGVFLEQSAVHYVADKQVMISGCNGANYLALYKRIGGLEDRRALHGIPIRYARKLVRLPSTLETEMPRHIEGSVRKGVQAKISGLLYQFMAMDAAISWGAKETCVTHAAVMPLIFSPLRTVIT